MSDRYLELDVPHAFTADLLLRDFYTTAVTDDPTIADTLLLTTVALKVLHRTEDALTEEPITLWLVGTVVDRLWLEYFST